MYTCHYGGQTVQEIIDSIQPNMFGMVIGRLVILEVQKVKNFYNFVLQIRFDTPKFRICNAYIFGIPKANLVQDNRQFDILI